MEEAAEGPEIHTAQDGREASRRLRCMDFPAGGRLFVFFIRRSGAGLADEKGRVLIPAEENQNAGPGTDWQPYKNISVSARLV